MSDIEIGARRIFLSETAREIEIVGQVTEGQFAGEFRYRYVADPARHGILSAEFLLSSTKPAPTAPSDHGPLAAPLSDRTLAKVLSRPAYVPPSELRERSEVEERVLKASLAWHNVDTDDFDALRDTFWAMKDAIADYAKAVQS